MRRSNFELSRLNVVFQFEFSSSPLKRAHPCRHGLLLGFMLDDSLSQTRNPRQGNFSFVPCLYVYNNDSFDLRSVVAADDLKACRQTQSVFACDR